MVEGHGCHRVAHFHRQKLLNRSFKATSPNGRFTDGAAAINNQPLTRIEVHGKNLFYFFGTTEQVVLHYHFGMAGAFSVHTPPHDPKPTTRLALFNKDENIVAHLSAMIVQHGDLDFYNSKILTLGEDPLRENANAENVWKKVSVSKKPIGLLLMDQSVVAGIGNIYRAEILFKAGVHPEQPGYSLSRPKFDLIWQHSVELLQRGFQSGSILTVDPEEAEILGAPWTRRYVYNHSTCGRCGTAVLSWDMASRTVYCCTTCQPLVNNTNTNSKSGGGAQGTSSILPAARVKAMAAARQAREFISHCAPDDVNDADTPFSKLTVAALKARAVAMDIPEAETVVKNLKKPELVALLDEFEAKKTTEMKKEKPEDVATDSPGVITTPLPVNKRKKLVQPGTARLVGKVATAKEAALEKVKAGEGRNVEHVALHDDEEERVLKHLAAGGASGSASGSGSGRTRSGSKTTQAAAGSKRKIKF